MFRRRRTFGRRRMFNGGGFKRRNTNSFRDSLPLIELGLIGVLIGLTFNLVWFLVKTVGSLVLWVLTLGMYPNLDNVFGGFFRFIDGILNFFSELLQAILSFFGRLLRGMLHVFNIMLGITIVCSVVYGGFLVSRALWSDNNVLDTPRVEAHNNVTNSNETNLVIEEPIDKTSEDFTSTTIEKNSSKEENTVKDVSANNKVSSNSEPNYDIPVDIPDTVEVVPSYSYTEVVYTDSLVKEEIPFVEQETVQNNVSQNQSNQIQYIPIVIPNSMNQQSYPNFQPQMQPQYFYPMSYSQQQVPPMYVVPIQQQPMQNYYPNQYPVQYMIPNQQYPVQQNPNVQPAQPVINMIESSKTGY